MCACPVYAKYVGHIFVNLHTLNVHHWDKWKGKIMEMQLTEISQLKYFSIYEEGRADEFGSLEIVPVVSEWVVWVRTRQK